MRPKLIVEIGVYGGRSLQAFAIALKHLGAGRVVGIDPWSKDAALESMGDEANRLWWSHLDYERVYRVCMEQLSISGVNDFVSILRQRSDDVDPSGWDLDILHVDGSHEEPAFRDITRYGARVRIGGICVCDDTKWSSGAPQRGVEWLLANGFIELYPLGTGAVYQRIR
jgi:predicted O-methyltransferase YrrM